MRRILSLWFLLCVPVVLSAQEQNIPGIGKVSPAKVAATGLQFTEGPAADAEGNVFFTDVPRSEIHKIGLDGKHVRFMEDTKGCNGQMFDTKGRLIACQGGEGRIVAIDPNTKAITPVATEYEGKRFNRPNDLAVDKQGGVYFSDPGARQGQTPQGKEGVYYVAPEGKVTRLLEGNRPNGIRLSPDEKTLYVLYSSDKTLHAFPLEQPGKIGPGKHFDAVKQPGDGMTVDTKGNLYVTQPRLRMVQVLSPEGKELGQIRVTENPSNVCFGGKEMRTLFITARTSVYAVETEVQGYCVARSGK